MKNLVVPWLLIVAYIFVGCTSDPLNVHLQVDTPTPNQSRMSAQNPEQDGSRSGLSQLDEAKMPLNPVDGTQLIVIPSGIFEMGADPQLGLEICKLYSPDCSLEDFADEAPLHLVDLSSFWIYRTEVTNLQYRLCVDEGDCSPPALPEFFLDDRFSEHPVVYVDWFSAKNYCEWAGGRLPTEAEWEKAARGTDGRLFPWGSEPECGLANVKGCTQGLTSPVGSFTEGASPYGVYDLAGNAAEWVSDWYSPTYYQESPNQDPVGPTTGEMRVVRGGSWKNPFTGVRSTNRSANFPEIFSSGVGFRCVVEPHQ